MKNKYLRVPLAMGLVISLGGCASLPSSGPVNESAPDVPTGPILSLTAAGPSQDATPRQIVEGFLRACSAGMSDDFTVARSFLGTDTASAWKPNQQIRIYASDSDLSITEKSDGSFTVKVAALASVDEDGRYTPAGSDSKITASFSLARGADMQWRISSLDDGLILSASSFDTGYVAAPLYFLTPDRAALVAEPRFYPRRKLAGYLLSGLLQGPPEDLNGIVTTALPAAGLSAGDGIEIQDGIARVSLPGDLHGFDASTRENIYRQLEATLRAVAGISDVSVTVNGVFLDRGETPSPRQVVPTYPLMIHKNSLVLRENDQDRVLLSAQSLGEMGISAPAWGGGDLPIVYLDKSHKNLFIIQNGVPVSLGSSDVWAAPVVDRRGWIWTAQGKVNPHLDLIFGDGTRKTVNVPWNSESQIKKLAISADGTRIAAITSRDSTSAVMVARIARDVNGTPVSLENNVQIPVKNEQLFDIAWTGRYSLGILSGAGQKRQIDTVPIFGPAKTISALDNAVAITAGTEEYSMLLATSNNALYARRGANWVKLLDDVRDPSYPGRPE